MNSVASMTGFAVVSGTCERGRAFALTVKAVNHRHLDLQVRLPLGLDALEPALRAVIKAQVRRGHVEVSMTLDRPALSGEVEWDQSILEVYVAAFRQAAQRFALVQEPDLNAFLRIPGVLTTSAATLNISAMETSVLEATGRLMAIFQAVRVVEGETLRTELRAGMERLARLAEEARRLRDGVAASEATRLKSRLQELLTGVEISEERVLTEAALLASRGDVEEELVRLRTHIDRFSQLLDAGGEVGRQLDFLLQELNREANTMLAKSGGLGGLRLTEIGIEMKVELERAREQVQNLE